MTKNKRFEFREVNCTAIVPKAYDNEKQQYANLFECIHWLNNLHKENEQLKEERNYFERKKCEYFNKYNKKHLDNIQLKKENNKLKSENEDMRRLINNISHQRDEFHRGARENANRVGKLKKENEELKEELTKFKEWEKHIGDVKREELDRVFKMSIYEIAEAFEYYKERIEKLERSYKNE